VLSSRKRVEKVRGKSRYSLSEELKMKRIYISILAILIMLSVSIPLSAVEIDDACMKGEPFTYGMFFHDDRNYTITTDLGMDLRVDIVQMLEGQTGDGKVVWTTTESGNFMFRPPLSGYYTIKVTNSSDNVRTFNIRIEEAPASKLIF
jgi:hypothetical protein